MSEKRKAIIETMKYAFWWLFILIELSYSQVSPTWLTSSYVQAASKKIIDGDACNCKTGNSQTPLFTFLFTTPFSQAPNLGYGCSGYQSKFIFIQVMIIWANKCSKSIEHLLHQLVLVLRCKYGDIRAYGYWRSDILPSVRHFHIISTALIMFQSIIQKGHWLIFQLQVL